MNQLPIEATVREAYGGGSHYQVRLHSVPRVGELIELHSHTEVLTGNLQARKLYEVVRIIHELQDVCDKFTQSRGGGHLVRVMVKPISGLPQDAL